jgi:hypothetical protein
MGKRFIREERRWERKGERVQQGRDSKRERSVG